MQAKIYIGEVKIVNIPKGYKRIWKGRVRSTDLVWYNDREQFDKPNDINFSVKIHGMYCVLRKIK